MDQYVSTLEKCGMKLGSLIFSPNTANQVFFYIHVLDRDRSFILRHDPRSKHIFENNNVTMPSEEDNHDDDNKE